MIFDTARARVESCNTVERVLTSERVIRGSTCPGGPGESAGAALARDRSGQKTAILQDVIREESVAFAIRNVKRVSHHHTLYTRAITSSGMPTRSRASTDHHRPGVAVWLGSRPPPVCTRPGWPGHTKGRARAAFMLLADRTDGSGLEARDAIHLAQQELGVRERR